MRLPHALNQLRTRLQNGPLKSGSFVRNVLTIFAGTALSQAIAIAALPILTRIFTPGQLGVLATFVAFTSILAIASSLSYQAAILLPKRDESAFVLYIGCLLINLIISSIIGFVVILLAPAIGLWLSYPDIENWIWFVPIGIVMQGCIMSTAIWFTRLKQFSAISKGFVAERLTTAASQLGISIVTVSTSGLIIGQTLGSMAGFLFLIRTAFKGIPQQYWRRVRTSFILILLHRYRRFPMYDLSSSITAAIARNLPVLLLSYFFTPAVVGFFAVGYRMVAGPLQLGAASVTQVFFQRANEARQKGNLDIITQQAFERLAAIFMTPLLLLCIAATELTVTILGDQWLEAGVYTRWLTLWLFFISIASPIHRLFTILEYQGELAIINGLLFVCSAGTLVAGGLTGDPVLTVALFSIVSTLVWIGQGIRILVIAGVAYRTYFTSLAKEFARTLPFAVILVATKLLTHNALIISGVFLLVLGMFGLIRVRYIFSNARH